MNGPVDATGTNAWDVLEALHSSFNPDLRAWFAADPDLQVAGVAESVVGADLLEHALSGGNHRGQPHPAPHLPMVHSLTVAGPRGKPIPGR